MNCKLSSFTSRSMGHKPPVVPPMSPTQVIVLSHITWFGLYNRAAREFLSINMFYVLLFGLIGSDRSNKRFLMESGGPEVDQWDSRTTFDVAAFDSLACSDHQSGTPVFWCFWMASCGATKGAGPQVRSNQSSDNPCCTVSLLLHVAKAHIEKKEKKKKASKSSWADIYYQINNRDQRFTLRADSSLCSLKQTPLIEGVQ